jgi:hypothetical protein
MIPVLRNIRQLIFIRHGEKVRTGLSASLKPARLVPTIALSMPFNASLHAYLDALGTLWLLTCFS